MTTKWMRRIAGCAVAALVLAGCAGSDGDEGPAEKPPATAPSTGTPVPSDEGSTEPAGAKLSGRQIDASALPKGYPVHVEVPVDATTLIVTAQESGCTKASAELLDETRERVIVLLVHTRPPGNPMCTMDIRYPKLVVQTESELGDRIVELKAEERVG